MSATDPYDVNYEGKFDIEYVGFSDEHYCFRLRLGGHKGLDACMFEKEVSSWLFDNIKGFYMGNCFPYKDHPKVALSSMNYDKKDSFVVLPRFEDALLFEAQFPVIGTTPSMLV